MQSELVNISTNLTARWQNKLEEHCWNPEKNTEEHLGSDHFPGVAALRTKLEKPVKEKLIQSWSLVIASDRKTDCNRVWHGCQVVVADNNQGVRALEDRFEEAISLLQGTESKPREAWVQNSSVDFSKIRNEAERTGMQVRRRGWVRRSRKSYNKTGTNGPELVDKDLDLRDKQVH